MELETKYQSNDQLLIEKKQKRDLMLANLKDYSGYLKILAIFASPNRCIKEAENYTSRI